MGVLMVFIGATLFGVVAFSRQVKGYRGSDFLKQGDLAYDRGQYAVARWAYDNVLLEAALAYVGRGRAYHAEHQHQRAIEEFDKAIQLDPDNAGAYYNRGVAYAFLGQDAKADADKAKACSLDSFYCR